MKRNSLKNVINFIFKYVWLIFALLILLEVGATTYTSTILMQQSTKGAIKSVQSEISGRVDGVLRLLNGISTNSFSGNLSIPMFKRATAADSYKESYDLYMIGFCDEKANVISSDEVTPPTKPFSLAYRDYMQRLYTTGKPQITDAFAAGADKQTMNYTVAVPILKNKQVKGSVFGSIYFHDIEDIIERSSAASGHDFYLLGSDSSLMAGKGDYKWGTNFDEESTNSYLFGTSLDEINKNIKDGKSGNFWQWDERGLRYVMYSAVAPTEWSLIYQVDYFAILKDLLPLLITKCIFYFLLCLCIAVLGKRYVRRNLASVDHLLERVTTMQRELFQTESTEISDYENLLDLTKTGLTDQLTGLATRAVLFKKMDQYMATEISSGALYFLDLDDLKRINDNFGHEAGDLALIHFAQVLKQYEQKYDGIAARYGGDEFILLLPNIDVQTAAKMGDQLCADLYAAIQVKELNFTIHSSIGVAHYPQHGVTLEELISKADLALYSAKQHGKNGCSSYDEI